MPYQNFSKMLLASYDGNKMVKHAFKHRLSDFHVSVIAKVISVLPDDIVGIKHQRFLVELPETDISLLVVHNIDYGERLHVAVGDVMKITGEYVWNKHGGLMHLTHHDPNINFEPGGAVVVEEVHANPAPTTKLPIAKKARRYFGHRS